MYKVFLVEDEAIIREGIKNKIKWEEEGFKIVGDESDGELAYPIILREQPDILITDIKMPFMDGWAFILLGENQYHIKTLTQALYSLLIRVCDGKAHYFGAAGREVYRVRDLQQSYLDANSAFSLRYFEKWDQFLSYNDVHNIRAQAGKLINVSELSLEKLDRSLLENFLKRGTINDVDEFVDSYFDGFASNAMDSTLFRNYIMMDGYSAIIKFLKELDCPKEKIDNSIKSLSSLTNQLSSLADFSEFYKSILKKAIDLRNKSTQKKYAGLIEQAKGKEVMVKILQDLDNIDVLVSQNDDMTFGAIEAIQEAGLTCGVNGDITIISFDAVSAAFDMMEKGLINVDIECNPLQGEMIAQIIESIEKGKKVAKVSYVEGKVFEAENASVDRINRSY